MCGANITELSKYMFQHSINHSYGAQQLECTNCNYHLRVHIDSMLWDMECVYRGSTQQWINDNQQGMQKGSCPRCQSLVVSQKRYDEPPPMILVNIEQQKVPVDTKLALETVDRQHHTYNLCGIIYLGDFHFVSRIIDKANNVWYYDGMYDATSMGVKEGKLKSSDRHNLLTTRNNRTASLVLYVLDKPLSVESD